MRLILALLAIIERLLNEWVRQRKKRREREYKADVDSINNDSVDYANEHFGGVHKHPNKTDPVPRNKAD